MILYLKETQVWQKQVKNIVSPLFGRSVGRRFGHNKKTETGILAGGGGTRTFFTVARFFLHVLHDRIVRFSG